MSQPQRILIIEIKTINNPGFDSSQLNAITIEQVGEELFLNNSFINLVMSAVLDAIIRLGSNFRHPLLFFVQVIPTNPQNEGSNKPPLRKRRRRRKN